MRCPFCRSSESKVVDSRSSEDGFTIRRRRVCMKCCRRFSTTETAALYVAKRSGVLEQFSKTKLLNGVRKAIQGRPVDDDILMLLAQKVEDEIRSRGVSQIDSYDVGLILLEPLKEIDEVAYLRFASVYRGFDSLDDFTKEITKLQKK